MRSGAQVTHDYQPRVIHRPDIALSIYGFVPRREPPILCAIDLPHFHSDNIFKPTELTDEEFGAPLFVFAFAPLAFASAAAAAAAKEEEAPATWSGRRSAKPQHAEP